jgi:predicted PurR-regulated permease PerM
VLFLIFMLAHTSERDPRNHVGYRCERKIYTYIRGKSAISGFVGGMHAFVLWLVGLQVQTRQRRRAQALQVRVHND